jgi:uncharacterized membrane protein
VTTSIYLLVRLAHVLVAALWFGSIAVLVLFVMPSIAQAGPAGGQVMNAMMRRGFGPFMPAIGGTTVLTGVLLYWRFTSGFAPALVHTHAGLAFGIGGLLGIASLLVGGLIVGRGSDALMRMAAELPSMVDGPEKALFVQRMTALRNRTATGGRVLLALVTVTITLMTLAHYI